EKGALPPAKEFWSLTMYDPAHNLVDNPINRYAIRDRTPGIKQETDGSTILYLQSTSPGADKESNWLPTPKQGAFSMALTHLWAGRGDHKANLAAAACEEGAVRKLARGGVGCQSLRRNPLRQDLEAAGHGEDKLKLF